MALDSVINYYQQANTPQFSLVQALEGIYQAELQRKRMALEQQRFEAAQQTQELQNRLAVNADRRADRTTNANLDNMKADNERAAVNLQLSRNADQRDADTLQLNQDKFAFQKAEAAKETRLARAQVRTEKDQANVQKAEKTIEGLLKMHQEGIPVPPPLAAFAVLKRYDPERTTAYIQAFAQPPGSANRATVKSPAQIAQEEYNKLQAEQEIVATRKPAVDPTTGQTDEEAGPGEAVTLAEARKLTPEYLATQRVYDWKTQTFREATVADSTKLHVSEKEAAEAEANDSTVQRIITQAAVGRGGARPGEETMAINFNKNAYIGGGGGDDKESRPEYYIPRAFDLYTKHPDENVRNFRLGEQTLFTLAAEAATGDKAAGDELVRTAQELLTDNIGANAPDGYSAASFKRTLALLASQEKPAPGASKTQWDRYHGKLFDATMDFLEGGVMVTHPQGISPVRSMARYYNGNIEEFKKSAEGGTTMQNGKIKTVLDFLRDNGVLQRTEFE